MTQPVETENQTSDGGPIYLNITGMSCGMCSGRVQKALNKVQGVRATVSIATKTATIETDGTIGVAELCEVVRATGYGAEPSDGAPQGSSAAQDAKPGALRRLVTGLMGHA